MIERKEVLLSEDELRQLCKEWQKRLRLQDWLIKVNVTRERDMMNEDAGGECEFKLAKKMATIRILDPIDYPDNLAFPHNMEWVLVHELLHLHFAPLYADTDDKSVHDAQEQAIDSISYALIREDEHGENTKIRS